MKKLLVVLLVLGLAAPAMAASQWYWYGTGRVMLGYVDSSKEFSGAQSIYQGIPSLDTSIRASGSETGVSDSGLVLNVADTTKIGARVVASDAVSGGVELSLFQVPTSAVLGSDNLSGDMMLLRVLYGQWKFGAGSLRVGQDYTPASFLLYSNEIGDLGWGSDEIMTVHAIPYVSRRPQLKLTMRGLQVALIEHNNVVSYSAIRALTNPRPAVKVGIYDAIYAARIAAGDSAAVAAATATATAEAALPGTSPVGATSDEDFNLPRIEVAYQWNINSTISLRPILGFQTYDAVARSGATEVSKTITSYLYGLGVNLRLGAAYVNLAAAGAVNPGNYGLYQPNQTYTRFASMNAAGDVKDANSMSGLIVAGFVINPTVKVEAGFGYLKTEGESYLFTQNGQFTKAEQTSLNYYIQAPITLAPGVIITPEIGWLDMGDLDNKTNTTKTKQGSNMWVAAQFRIDF